MIIDVVHWNDNPTGCNRCSFKASRYITPYYRPRHRVCPTCCIELTNLFTRHGWPPQIRTE